MQITTWPVDASTRLVGILGYPVSHSFSPAMHNAAFFTRGLNFRYVALPVLPSRLEAAVRGLGSLGFAGANVTIPHKEAVIPMLDVLTPTARAVGAVNTIVCRYEDMEVTLRGDNTDVAGFLAPLAAHEKRLRTASAVILGAGGAARAAVYGLLGRFDLQRITVAARKHDRANRLCEAFSALDSGGILKALPLSEAGPCLRQARLVVNATPVGMHPQVAETPWPDMRVFHAGQIVYDMVYRPRVTRLLREAGGCGAETVDGLSMLLHQAAAAWCQWTGRPMPLEAAREALRACLR